MDTGVSSWLVIALMAVAANLPFFTESLFGVVRLKRAEKPFVARLFELLVLGTVVLGVARGLESSVGNAFTQGWQFWVISICLLLVFAFPGFVLRYLRRHHATS